MRSVLYPQLIQMTYNSSHLLAIVIDQYLQEDDVFLMSSAKHIQNLLCYGIALKGDQRYQAVSQSIDRNFQIFLCSIELIMIYASGYTRTIQSGKQIKDDLTLNSKRFTILLSQGNAIVRQI